MNKTKDKGKESPTPGNVIELDEIDDLKTVHIADDGRVTVQVSKDQMDNILNVKKASELTDVDDLKYQNGKLRTMLEMWSEQVVYDGKLYLIQVDPLNRIISMLNEEQNVG